MPDTKEHIGPLNNPLINFIASPRYRWLRHLLFFTLGLILAFKGDIGSDAAGRPANLRDNILLADAITFAIIMVLIYFLLYVLVPKLLFRSRIFLFFLSFLGLIVIIYFSVWFTNLKLIQPIVPRSMPQIGLSLMNFIQIAAVCSVLLGAVVGLKVFKKWILDVGRLNEIQRSNMKSELEQLKSQVNPHFLFNTLNNLLVLMKTDPEKATQVLLGLSDLLRYQLYDSAREKIVLTKDVQFLQNLLALEKIRKDDFEYQIRTEGKLEGIQLPPFLFIPFVENAIKHGASTAGYSYLNISISISNNRLTFEAENSKPAIKNTGVGGLGLKNICRRLDLLFPDNYSLDKTETDTTYFVKLIIPI
ncbi:MAG: histidine kinase [Chitinophagaceae bacterium]|nr:histidine kinase [Chitinophagaceae bacterium]